MKQVLVCKSCKRELTTPLWIYQERLGRRRGKKGYLRIPAPDNSPLRTITRKMDFDECCEWVDGFGLQPTIAKKFK